MKCWCSGDTWFAHDSDNIQIACFAKPKGIQFTIIEDLENQQMFTFKKFVPADL